MNIQTLNKLNNMLEKINKESSQQYLKGYLADEVDTFLKQNPGKNYYVLVRICSAEEVSYIEDKEIENLGTTIDYGSDDPHNFEGKRLYFFNMGKNSTELLRSNLEDRIGVVEKIHNNRAQQGLEREDDYSMSGVAVVLLPEEVLRSERDKISFGKLSVYNNKGAGTRELEETCFSPEVLEHCEVFATKDIYTELQNASNSYDLLSDYVNECGSKALRKLTNDYVKEIESRNNTVKFSFEEKQALESYENFIKDNGSKDIGIYLPFFGLTPKVFNHLVDIGSLDIEDEKVKAFAETLCGEETQKSEDALDYFRSYDEYKEDDDILDDGSDGDFDR